MARVPNHNFSFYGSPAAMNAASQAGQAFMAADAQRYAADARRDAALGQSRGNTQQVLLQQPGVFTGQAVDLTNAYGQNLAGMLGAYGGALGQYFGGLQGLGSAAAGMYGGAAAGLGGVGQAAANAAGQVGSNAVGAMGQLGTSGANALGNLGVANQSALGGLYNSSNSALANAYQASMAGQAASDAANAQAAGQVGAANQGAMSQVGQAALNNLGSLGGNELAANAGILASANQAASNLGAAQSASLANQAIAAANAYGQMATGMYNMQGQLGNSMAAVAAAENAALGNAAAAQQAAGPQYAKLEYLRAALPEILATTQYGMQAAPYGASALGGLTGAGGGGVGFSAYGPEGLVASGSAPSWSGGGSGGDFTAPPQPPGVNPIDFSYTMPELPDFSAARTGTQSFLDSLLENATSESAAFRSGLDAQLDANREATMDSRAFDAIDRTLLSGSDYADRIQSMTPELLGSLAGGASGALGGIGRGGNYGTGGVFSEIRGNTADGRDALESGFGTALSGLGDIMGGAAGGIRGAASDAYGNIGGAIGGTAAAMQPFLTQGQMALDNTAGQMGAGMNQFAQDYGTATGTLGDAFQQTYGDIFGTYGETIGPLFGRVFGTGQAERPSNEERIAQLQNMIPGLTGSRRRFYEDELQRRLQGV